MSDSRNLGRYQLIAELARGGMGLVYLAISSGLGGFNKLLVLKELKPELVDDAGFLEMFLEEARLAAHLNHPNIVTTYEVGIDANRPFIVMDYLEGQTLGRFLKKKPSDLTLPMLLRVLCFALDGLHYAHTRESFDGTTVSIVHRDVSPQNIFVTYDGQVKVVDFGIAKASDTTVETRTGVFKGKPSYMAPEQLRGEPDVRADVYSIGVILWELVADRRMWPRKTDVEIMTSLLKSEIPSIDEHAPSAPAEIRRICQKALTPDPSDRYQTARAMREDIDAYLSSIGDRTSGADVGAVLARAFGEQRTKVRRLVEKALNEAKTIDLTSRSKLPSISPPPEDSSHPSGPRLSDSRVTSTTGSLGTPGGAVLGAEVPPERKRPLPWVLAGVGVLGVVGGLFAFKTCAVDKATKETATPPSASASAPAPPVLAASTPEPTPSTPASASVAESASAKATAVAPPPPRYPYVRPPAPAAKPPPEAPKTAIAPPAPAPAPSAPKTDCNPPFYFEGSKKVFKPGCL